MFPLFNSPQLTYVLADHLLIAKSTGACTSGLIGLDDIGLCLSFSKLTLMAGDGDPLLRISGLPNLEGSF